MIKAVVIPHGRSGVVGGAMLGLGRAMGETVAVYTVLNIVFQVNWHVLLGAGGNVASLIILKFGEASAYEIKASNGRWIGSVLLNTFRKRSCQLHC